MISSVPVVIPQQHNDDDDDTIDGGNDVVEIPAQQSDYDRFWELLYDNDCDNPIIHQLCQTGIELITTAKKQRETCDVLLAQHLTLDDMQPPQKRARVEQMIRLAKNLGQTDFSTIDIKHFYEILAPSPTTTDTSRRCSRRRKRPAPPPAVPKRIVEKRQQQQQEAADESHGGEN